MGTHPGTLPLLRAALDAAMPEAAHVYTFVTSVCVPVRLPWSNAMASVLAATDAVTVVTEVSMLDTLYCSTLICVPCAVTVDVSPCHVTCNAMIMQVHARTDTVVWRAVTALDTDVTVFEMPVTVAERDAKLAVSMLIWAAIWLIEACIDVNSVPCVATVLRVPVVLSHSPSTVHDVLPPASAPTYTQ